MAVEPTQVHNPRVATVRTDNETCPDRSHDAVDLDLGRGWVTGSQRYQFRRAPDRRPRDCGLLDEGLLHHRVVKRKRRLEMWFGREQIQWRADTLDVVSQIPDFDGTPLPQQLKQTKPLCLDRSPGSHHLPSDTVPEDRLTLDQQNVNALPGQRDRQRGSGKPPADHKYVENRTLSQNDQRRLLRASDDLDSGIETTPLGASACPSVVRHRIRWRPAAFEHLETFTPRASYAAQGTMARRARVSARCPTRSRGAVMGEPSITTTVEPREGLTFVSYLKCAPSSTGGQETGYLNLAVNIVNTGVAKLRVIKAEVWVPNSTTAPKSWSFMLPPWQHEPGLSQNQSVLWTQDEDYLFAIPPGPLSVRVRIWVTIATDPYVFQTSLIPHANPTPQGNYRFWGAVRDLRPGEFWQVHGTSHAQAAPQLFAYDVGVAIESGSSYLGNLPNTDSTKNEHSRIWGKPIYAVADGEVVHCRNDFPSNPNPVPGGQLYAEAFPELDTLWRSVGDGNGNFFTIATGDETVLYAHMQPGSLNPNFLHPGAAVKAGDYLGLVGNSGHSYGPHLHIHANKTVAGGTSSWENMPRPMLFRNARAVAWPFVGANATSAPWVALNGRGIPPVDCAIWPSDSSVVNLRNTAVRHFAFSDQGQLWVIRNNDAEVRTSNDRLPGSGFYLDVNPGGAGREVALVLQTPYVIGTDGRLWEGTSSGWVQAPNSPELRRITVDATSRRLWAITEEFDVVMFDPVAKVWKSRGDGGQGKDICAANGVVHVIGMDDHVWKSTGASGWERLPGEGVGLRIAIDRLTGTIWMIGWTNGIWAHSGGGDWGEHAGGGVGTDIRIHQGTPYIVGSDHGLWRSAGAAGWERLNVIEAK